MLLTLLVDREIRSVTDIASRLVDREGHRVIIEHKKGLNK